MTIMGYSVKRTGKNFENTNIAEVCADFTSNDNI